MAKFKFNLAGYFKYRLLDHLLRDMCECEQSHHIGCRSCKLEDDEGVIGREFGRCSSCDEDEVEFTAYNYVKLIDCFGVFDALREEARHAWEVE